MPSQREVLTFIVDKNGQTRGLRFDPKTKSFSFLEEMVTDKVRSIEDTTIFMYHPGSVAYVDPARLHRINHLPQQEKRKAIQRITTNITYADRVLIYSQVTKKQ